jgi:DDE superfamily endonuclease
MSGKLFHKWIIWFNNQVSKRRVLFFIDGFSAHQTGLAQARNADELSINIRVEFFPANATSVCQPLDQGIIRTWKAYYLHSIG